MKHTKINTKISVTLILAAILLAPTLTLAASYPKAAPTAWYTEPNSWLGFSGSGFAPGETVTFSGAVKGSVVANANGVVSLPDAFVVPYSWQNSKKTIVMTGSVSAYAIPLTITIGSFYPNVTPSTYYVAAGQLMTATATGFAPGESVALWVNGSLVASGTANQAGTKVFTFAAPTGGSSFTVLAVGQSSGRSTSRTVTLH